MLLGDALVELSLSPLASALTSHFSGLLETAGCERPGREEEKPGGLALSSVLLSELQGPTAPVHVSTSLLY